MYQDKNVLLIAGGGTLGMSTAKVLLRLGCFVDILCPEDKVSDHERLVFHKGWAEEAVLKELITKKHYHGIVNFVHYPEVEDYKPIHTLLTANTDHLIFLSSYRVYADLKHPVTEDAPMLLDVTEDKEFLETEKYAISKAKCEKFLREGDNLKNCTIVRPVISFSHLRFDIVMCSNQKVLEKAQKGQAIMMPAKAKNLVAGLDWAGNSGKLIANLLFKENTFGEAYTISSAQNLTWGEVADLYTKLIGAKFEWLDLEAFWESGEEERWKEYALIYDRLFDRTIDNTKVLEATGLKAEDFVSIEEGIKIELAKVQ